VITVSQRLANGLDNFALLAIPFYLCRNPDEQRRDCNTLNQSGAGDGWASARIAGHVNVLANMMFGSISGSAVAAAAAVGGTLNPIQRQKATIRPFPQR
jgi:hypothetical protein